MHVILSDSTGLLHNFWFERESTRASVAATTRQVAGSASTGGERAHQTRATEPNKLARERRRRSRSEPSRRRERMLLFLGEERWPISRYSAHMPSPRLDRASNHLLQPSSCWCCTRTTRISCTTEREKPLLKEHRPELLGDVPTKSRTPIDKVEIN